MIITYKYRFYPNEKQKIIINNTYFIIRKYWNKLLKEKIEHNIKYNSILMHDIKNIKIEEKALGKSEYDFSSILNSLFQLNELFSRNTRKNIPLKYKTEFDNQTFFINNNTDRISITNNLIVDKRLGILKVSYSREIPSDAAIKKITILKTKTNKYFLCISFFIKEKDKNKIDIDNAIGLDYSISHFYIDSNGRSRDLFCDNDFIIERIKIKKLFIELKNKISGSSNYNKIYQKILKYNIKIKNKRNDILHKESSELVKKYDIISVESLSAKEIANHNNIDIKTGYRYHFGKQVYDSSYQTFIKYLEYKCNLYGKVFIAIDKYFPSSKICNSCGYYNKLELELSKRIIICPKCGKRYNRDINAAKNIRDKGVKEYISTQIKSVSNKT
ncbi:transposase [bacterium]|nr:transposase [bacterium]